MNIVPFTVMKVEAYPAGIHNTQVKKRNIKYISLRL